MFNNLTETQRDILSWMVKEVREGHLSESFGCYLLSGRRFFAPEHPRVTRPPIDVSKGILRALEQARLILVEFDDRGYATCTLLQRAYDAVDTNFIEPESEIDEQLLTKLLSHPDFFNLSELRELVYKMGFDPENIPGETKDTFARQLVLYFKRHSTLRALLDTVFSVST